MVSGLGSDESSAEVPLMERIQPGVITRVWYAVDYFSQLMLMLVEWISMACSITAMGWLEC